MENYFFDPVSYQFYFSAVSEQEYEPCLLPYIREVFVEMIPYIEVFAKLSKPATVTFYRMDGRFYPPLTADNVCQECNNIEELLKKQEKEKFIAFFHLRKFIPKELQVQLSTADKKEMMDRVSMITNKREDPEKICRLMGCPTEDLRGILFPSKYIWDSYIGACYVSRDLKNVHKGDKKEISSYNKNPDTTRVIGLYGGEIYLSGNLETALKGIVRVI